MRTDIQRSCLRLDPGIVEYKGMKFLITDRPSKINIKHYVAALKKYNVNSVICVQENCDNNNNNNNDNNNNNLAADNIDEFGIQVINLDLKEGSIVPQQIIDQWLKILRIKYRQNPYACVAVNSTSGLGRASVLVALALIELGLKCDSAVDMIRSKLRGAISDRQMIFLKRYKPKNRLKFEKPFRSIFAAFKNPVILKVNFQISPFSISQLQYVRLN